MAYLVKIMPRAELDLARIYIVKDADHSQAAREWYFGMKDAIYTLEQNPERCPVTFENAKFRQLLYGNKPHVYRIIYRISGKKQVIEVLHIRHGARNQFKSKQPG